MTEEDTQLSREEHFSKEVKFRQDEVDGYQRNIDKYETAIQRIDVLYPKEHELHDKMQDFKDELQKLIGSDRYQQARANMMLDACQVQLEQAKTEEFKS